MSQRTQSGHSHFGEQHHRQTETTGAPPVLSDIAAKAGVRFNGDNPWDIQVFDDRVYRRILTQGSLGLGESYMDNMWECLALDELFARLLSSEAEQQLGGWAKLRLLGEIIRQNLFNLQTSRRAFDIGASQ